MLEEELEGVSMDVEDFEPQTVIADVLAKEKRGSFLKAIGVEVRMCSGRGGRMCPPRHRDVN